MNGKEAEVVDDFIGIDINVEPPGSNSKQRAPSKRGGTSRKRPRPSSTANAATEGATRAVKRPKKPKPPPPPPKSLISLLQKDNAVRNYFVSLQDNLDYDVNKWKFEAAKWKWLAASASGSARSANAKNNGGAAARAKKSARKNAINSSTIGRAKQGKLQSKNVEDDGSAIIPITDEALFGNDDDSDDDSDSSSHASSADNVPVEQRKCPPENIERTNHQNSQLEIHDNEFEAKRRLHTLNKLKEAKQCLDLLGVSLVEVEVITTTVAQPEVDGENVQDQTPETQNVDTPVADWSDLQTTDEVKTSSGSVTCTKIERILHRQSDEKVAAELLASFKTLIKSSSFVGYQSQMTAAALDVHTKDDDNDDVSDADNETKAQGINDNDQLSNEERMRRYKLKCQYHPFCCGCRDGKLQLHIPNVYHSNIIDRSDACKGGVDEESTLPPHPASIGLNHILNILSIMDTYCGDNVDDDDWNAIFPCFHGDAYITINDGVDMVQQEQQRQEDVAILKIGMRNRCRLTERVLSSLDVEITRIWAITDRITNLNTSTIHFHPGDILDNEDNPSIENEMYGAKSFNRLANLEERIGHARIASTLHYQQGNLQKVAELVVGYIISCTPTMNAEVEEYPKLPPVLSMCVLEALLARDDYIPSAEASLVANEGWFEEHIQEMFSTSSFSSQDEEAPMHQQLLKALAYPIHVAASIWKERSYCADDRIRDVAYVELAAYKRIQKLCTLLSNPPFDMMDMGHVAKVGTEILSLATSTADSQHQVDNHIQLRAVSKIACIISLLALGDVDRIIELCKNILSGLNNGTAAKNPLFLLPACCSAYSSIMDRRWETMKLLGSSANASGRNVAAAFAIEDKFSPILDSISERIICMDDYSIIDVMIQCFVLLGDGHRLQQLVDKVLPGITQSAMENENGTTTASTPRALMSRTISALIDAGEIPTVRVINLKRRPDRALDFMGCAVRKEQLFVIKGPAKLRRKQALIAAWKNSSLLNEDEKCLDGNFAFDGQCNRDELEDQVQQRLDEKGCLSDFVAAKWRPSELKAFDRDARDDFELVHTSMTEKACALSHIASWMGVESTLSEYTSISGEYDHIWYQKKLRRMFKLSGFARGDALLLENEGMDPVPVCVILEDDAVLVDRFAERLASLLEDLPRDFHFCSLGYSRPKAAPMVEYSTHLGIPSCLWYLTGYVLSLEGARHLIKSLPVTGPVDSWIGLKMCSNWDNKFGDMMGVGNFTKAKTKLPPRKDLAKIMKFRAFAALVPLCAQKVRVASSSSALTRGGWRDKDTDITYSG